MLFLVSVSSLTIIFLSVLEKILAYLRSRNATKNYLELIFKSLETGKEHGGGPASMPKLMAWSGEIILWVILFTVILNAVASLIFIYSRIY